MPLSTNQAIKHPRRLGYGRNKNGCYCTYRYTLLLWLSARMFQGWVSYVDNRSVPLPNMLRICLQNNLLGKKERLLSEFLPHAIEDPRPRQKIRGGARRPATTPSRLPPRVSFADENQGKVAGTVMSAERQEQQRQQLRRWKLE